MADQIVHDLHEHGRRAWGFVIYRCTYQSNTVWAEFMGRLLANTEHKLENNQGLDLLDNLALTVIEDLENLDRATMAVIRDHVRQWVVTAVQEEPDITSPVVLLSQRYTFLLKKGMGGGCVTD
ncbi:uncharacterized protein N7473_009844 [Penicillium subrubescens]|jgi:hypothetical protein|uniref:Uncharacterized protein n=1 Tax=Penicillium subrubescens TaxID=1316194 RepID=A0A1Q5TC52_9EURO|nr:uncharacterized protein N7473_009844 [Penicillium subrubescens]KAJ5882958.1 hypothetical protein N7473_009844 [Penicillium subrubescens]OKO97805.1 hypothetical protein PENSUB_9731 [Penicillium subrubescens]